MIRAYRPADLDEVVAVFTRAVREVARRDYSPEQVAAWAPDVPDLQAWARRLDAGRAFVCERDGAIAGFVLVDHTGCIVLLFVHPAHQRRGVARALMDRAVAWARAQGIRRLHTDASITARPFFERAGFALVAEQEVERRGVRFRNFRMERVLEAQSA